MRPDRAGEVKGTHIRLFYMHDNLSTHWVNQRDNHSHLLLGINAVRYANIDPHMLHDDLAFRQRYLGHK